MFVKEGFLCRRYWDRSYDNDIVEEIEERLCHFQFFRLGLQQFANLWSGERTNSRNDFRSASIHACETMKDHRLFIGFRKGRGFVEKWAWLRESGRGFALRGVTGYIRRARSSFGSYEAFHANDRHPKLYPRSHLLQIRE